LVNWNEANDVEQRYLNRGSWLKLGESDWQETGGMPRKRKPLTTPASSVPVPSFTRRPSLANALITRSSFMPSSASYPTSMTSIGTWYPVDGNDLTLSTKLMMKKMVLTAVAAFALVTGAQAQTVNPDVDMHGLRTSNFRWQRGDLFKDLCTAQVRFTNTGVEAVGNIHYRTYYVFESGIVHENSIIDAVIEKVIQPGETRTIELEKFLVPVDCDGAGMDIEGCEILSQFTKLSNKQVIVERKSAVGPIVQAEKNLQHAWDSLNASKKNALRADQREWIKRKDAMSGDEKLAAIENRTTYLEIQ
jgi:hypothetical protein